jgi:hypothetical protein
MKKIFFVLPLLIFVTQLSAQIFPPINCEDAYSICDSIVTQDTIKVGMDTNPDEISNNSCLTFGEIRGTWYKFGVNSVGNLRFTITPLDTLTDFDWALFRIDWGNCTDIYGNPAYEVSCNEAGISGGNYTTGATGLVQQGHNPAVNITTPALFYLYVTTSLSDTDAVLGYTIDFTASDFNLVGCGEIGIEKYEEIKHTVYPNPAHTIFYFDSDEFDEFEYTLSDITGKVVKQGMFWDSGDAISVAGLNPGLYYYSIYSYSGQKVSGKIMVN